MYRQRKNSYLPAALLAAFLAVPVFGGGRELNPPELRVSLQKSRASEQSVSAEKLPGGESALRIENKAPNGFCEFSIPGGMALEGFDELKLTVRLDRARSSALKNFSVRIVDATGETLQYTLDGKALPDGDSLLFRIGREQKPFTSWGGNKDGKIDQPARLAGGAFRFRTGGGTLVLRGFSAETVVPYAAVPAVSPVPGEGGFLFFRPGGEAGKLSIHNPNAFAVEAELAYRIIRADEKKAWAEESVPLSLAANESATVPFEIPEKFGLYELRSAVTLKGRSAAGPEQGFRFASMIPAGPDERTGGDFLFGICCQHLPRLSAADMEKEIAASALCGAQIVRFCSYWDVMEPRRGEWNFAPLDRVFRLMESCKLKSQVLHSRLPNWAAASDWKSIRKEKQGKPGRPQPDFDAWRNFVRTYARRYAGKAMFTEIWNEPDLYSFADFSTEAYLKLLRISAEETRANDPGTQILSAGFATIPTPGWGGGNGDIAERTMTEGKNDYDVFALHNHSLMPSCVPVVNRFEAMRKRVGADDKKWYMNESGLTTRGSTEFEQAATLFRKLLFCRSRGAIAYNWYNLRNDGWDKSNGEHNFGLLLHDYQPKQSYITYNMLTTLYAGGTFVRTLEANDDFSVLLFRDFKGDWLAACFLNRSNGAARNLTLTGITGTATRYDLFGNSVELPVLDGAVTLDLAREPLTLKITGAEPALFGELARFVESPGLYRDRDNRFVLEVKNPTRSDLQYRISAEVPATLAVRFEAAEGRLAPGASKQIGVFVRPNGGGDSAGSGRISVSLGSLGTVALDLPADFIRTPGHGGFRAEPDFVLNDRSQVSVQVPSAPEYEKLVWKGPEDLGAKVFLAEDKGVLRLRVDVTDDLHVQKFRDDGLWQGDSVQFIVAPEGVRGFWRFGLSLDPEGKPEVYLWDAPNGESKSAMTAAARLGVTRDDAAHRTVYDFAVPAKALGIDGRAFRFNLLVNDNDGAIRESFIEAVPGLGRNLDVKKYPLYKDDTKE